MEPKALVLVFHAWDMDMCTLPLRNDRSLSAEREREVAVLRMLVERS
jgi:hypothetical protein